MKVLMICSAIFMFLFILDSCFTFLYCKRAKFKEEQKDSTKSQPKICCEKKGRDFKLSFQIKRYIRIYEGWIQVKLNHLGRIPCQTYRNFILRKIYFMDMAKTAVLYGNFEIRSPWNIKIGKGSIIGDASKLDGRNGIQIGNHVNFSTGVWIWTAQHDMNNPFFYSSREKGKVIIGDRAWLSTRTIILPGITIGEGTVIAAGAVVTKNSEPFSVIGGVPGKKIGERSRDLRYEFDGTHEAFL